MLLKGELHQPHDYMTSIINPDTTDGMTVMSLSASLQQKTSIATDYLCQIVLNQK
jgi:hypothetical protein